MRGPASRAAPLWVVPHASLAMTCPLPCSAIAVGEAETESEGLPGARKLDKCPECRPAEPAVKQRVSEVKTAACPSSRQIMDCSERSLVQYCAVWQQPTLQDTSQSAIYYCKGMLHSVTFCIQVDVVWSVKSRVADIIIIKDCQTISQTFHMRKSVS